MAVRKGVKVSLVSRTAVRKAVTGDSLGEVSEAVRLVVALGQIGERSYTLRRQVQRCPPRGGVIPDGAVANMTLRSHHSRLLRSDARTV